MAHARGAIVLAAAQRETPVFGYAATRIKKTLTGSGRAPKAQIQHAIMTELGLDRLPEPHDVADACAVALCHFHISRNQRAGPGPRNRGVGVQGTSGSPALGHRAGSFCAPGMLCPGRLRVLLLLSSPRGHHLSGRPTTAGRGRSLRRDSQAGSLVPAVHIRSSGPRRGSAARR